jgi:iron complex outermembrane receptor protein
VRRIISIILILSAALVLTAQPDSVLLLPEAEVVALRAVPTDAGNNTEHWDSSTLLAYRAENLAQLLQKESGVFIKNYGPGSIATISMRGSGAGHTVIVWNGIPLQSPMLGLLDLSLLPVGFLDEGSVSFGGNNARWGSGAIGGVVQLGTKSLFINGLNVNLHSTAGSFGFWNHGATLRYGGRIRNKIPISGSTRILIGKAENDFPFRPLPGLPKRKQSHAAQCQLGILQEISVRPYGAGELTFHFWQQFSTRQIPPTVQQSRSLAKQEDQSLRAAFHWKHTARKSLFQLRSGFFKESIDYQDSLSGVFSFTKFHSSFSEFEHRWHISPKTLVQSGLLLQATRAFAEAYSSPPTEWRKAVFSSAQQDFGAWLLQFDARQEWRDGDVAPFIPAFGVNWQLAKWAIFKGKISRLYRYPTLNDRYWQPGGNSGLLPEKGWEQTLTGQVRRQIDSWDLQFSATAWHRRLQNWIQWSLKTGESYWSAANVSLVQSRGIENRFRLIYRAGRITGSIALGFDHLVSTYENAVIQPKIEKGDQVWYVPENQVLATLDLKMGPFRFTLRQQYTGGVTTPGNPLPGYWLTDAGCQLALHKTHWNGHVLFHIDNLLNAPYYVVEWRPMPGRHFRSGLVIQFGNTNRK